MQKSKKHPGGRPIEYTKELPKKVKDYLVICQDKHEVKYKPITDREGNINEVPYVEYNVKVPTIEGLAIYLGIHKDTIYDWEQKYPEFSDVIAQLRAQQADTLINKGLAGSYNATITKVLLTKHGYIEKQETDITTQGQKLNTVSPEAIALAKEYEERIKKGL